MWFGPFHRHPEMDRHLARAKEQDMDRHRREVARYHGRLPKGPGLFSPFRAAARFFRRHVGRVDRIGPDA